MLKSFVCLECSKTCQNIPLLVCSHFVCPACYMKRRNNGLHNCSECGKKLKRRLNTKLI